MAEVSSAIPPLVLTYAYPHDIMSRNDLKRPIKKEPYIMSTLRLQGKIIGVFVAQEVEDLEFWVPVMRLREEGAHVIVIGLSSQTVRGKHGLEMTPRAIKEQVTSKRGLIRRVQVPLSRSWDAINRVTATAGLVPTCLPVGSVRSLNTFSFVVFMSSLF